MGPDHPRPLSLTICSAWCWTHWASDQRKKAATPCSSALEELSQQLDGRHQQSHRSRGVSGMASRWQWLWTGPRLIGGWVGALRDPGPLMSALPCLPPPLPPIRNMTRALPIFQLQPFYFFPTLQLCPSFFESPLLPVQEMKEHKDVCS